MEQERGVISERSKKLDMQVLIALLDMETVEFFLVCGGGFLYIVHHCVYMHVN